MMQPTVQESQPTHLRVSITMPQRRWFIGFCNACVSSRCMRSRTSSSGLVLRVKGGGGETEEAALVSEAAAAVSRLAPDSTTPAKTALANLARKLRRSSDARS
jgi:hypothetical protein